MQFEQEIENRMESLYKNNGTAVRAQNIMGTPKQSIRQLGRSTNVVRKFGSSKKY